MTARLDRPALNVGDVILHRGSVTGRAEIREVLFVDGRAKFGGPRWRVLVLFPQTRSSEIGPRGSLVVQHVDAATVRRVGQGRLF